MNLNDQCPANSREHTCAWCAAAILATPRNHYGDPATPGDPAGGAHNTNAGWLCDSCCDAQERSLEAAA